MLKCLPRPILCVCFCASFILALGGCASTHRPPFDRFGLSPPQYGVEIFGATENQRKVIGEALSYMPLQVRRAVLFIEVVPDLGTRWGKDILGECNSYGLIKIESVDVSNPNERRLFMGSVWHEVTHAYHFKIRNDGFTGKWREIAGDVYVGSRWIHLRAGDFPKKGLLTPYAASEAYEDVAEYVEAIYGYISDTIWIDGKRNPLFDVPKGDDRYFRKVTLLFIEGFISESDYQKISSLLHVAAFSFHPELSVSIILIKFTIPSNDRQIG